MLKTKIGRRTILLVVVAIAFLVWDPLNIRGVSPFGGPQPEVPNVQTRTHKVPDRVRNGSTVTIMLIWTRPYTPSGVNITTSKGTTHFDQQHLPALVGTIMAHDLYDPHVQYGISAIQADGRAGPTDCEISIDNVSVDKDRLNGDGLLECWVGARA